MRVGTKEFHAQCTKCGNVFGSADKPHQDIYQANPPGKEKDVPEKEAQALDQETERLHYVDRHELKPWEDPEDLSSYLEPYQNDVPYEPDYGDFGDLP